MLKYDKKFEKINNTIFCTRWLMFIPCKKPRSSSPTLASSGLYYDYEVHMDIGVPR